MRHISEVISEILTLLSVTCEVHGHSIPYELEHEGDVIEVVLTSELIATESEPPDYKCRNIYWDKTLHSHHENRIIENHIAEGTVIETY